MKRVALALVALGACRMAHVEAPRREPHDARGGFAPPGFDPSRACSEWKVAVQGDEASLHHDSFPELDAARACYTPVRYRGEVPTPDPAPAGCAYRAADHLATLRAEADRDDRIAHGVAGSAPLPIELACDLSDDARRAAAANNARTLRALAREDPGVSYPYATVETFGYGNYAHAGTPLDAWKPGDACLPGIDLQRFGVNVDRATRAALAWSAGVAPALVVSGGAVHSKLVEAFLLDYIATCRIGVPADRVLLDPCARHTHTNIRNAARLLHATGGRVSYIVTDDEFQATYLEEWTAFDLFGGSLDQRSLRDFHHLLGSWRRASIGIGAGFWFTPYRFWADSRFADFSCEK